MMMSIVTQSKEECPQNVHHGFIVTSLGLYEHDSTLNMSCVNDVKEAFLESVDVEEDEIVELVSTTTAASSPKASSHAYSPFSYGIPTAAAAFLACCILSSMSSL